MTMDPRALWTMSYGMYLVTARSGGRANGQIANAVFQVTAEPPRVAIAINKENFTHDLIRDGGWFAFSVLADTVPMEFIGLFGFKSGRDVDKLAQATVREGLHVPLVVEHAVAVTEARVLLAMDAGTHTVFIGEAAGAEVLSTGAPLTYAGYHARKGGRRRTLRRTAARSSRPRRRRSRRRPSLRPGRAASAATPTTRPRATRRTASRPAPASRTCPTTGSAPPAAPPRTPFSPTDLLPVRPPLPLVSFD